MENIWVPALGRQFTASIDMLENAILACPNGLWDKPMWANTNMPAEFSDFWYVAYHTLFWLDLYLSGSKEGFNPPAPFTLDELDPAGKLPERVYTKAELQTYLSHCREKFQAIAGSLSEGKAAQMSHFHWGDITYAELLLYVLRHTQEHAAQMNMFLGQQTGHDSEWVSGVEES